MVQVRPNASNLGCLPAVPGRAAMCTATAMLAHAQTHLNTMSLRVHGRTDAMHHVQGPEDWLSAVRRLLMALSASCHVSMSTALPACQA